MSADVKMKTKVRPGSESLALVRHYFDKAARPKAKVYEWRCLPIHYRSGTSDTALIYSVGHDGRMTRKPKPSVRSRGLP